MKNILGTQKLLDQTTILIKENRTKIKDIFALICNTYSEKNAFIYHQADGSNIYYTYKDFENYTISYAKKLSTLLKDKKKGGVIALKFHNSPFWCAAFYAILMLGFKVLLIDAKLAKENTTNLLKSAHAIAIISDDDVKYEIPSFTKREIQKTTENNEFNPIWEDEVIFCSSGTTGNIKLIIFNGSNLIHQLNSAHELYRYNLDIIYDYTGGDLRIMSLIPLHHIFGFIATFLWYTYFGKTIVFTKVNEPLTLINDIRNLKITHLYHVPLFYNVVYKNFMNQIDEKTKEKVIKVIEDNIAKKKSLFNHIITNKIQDKLLGRNIRFLISGGGYLSQEVSRFFNGIGYSFNNGYGMTEVGVTSVELSMKLDNRIKCSIGRPFFGVDYKLGPNNELLIKSLVIHKKEIIDGEIKNTIFDNEGYFKTGDIAKIDEDGRCYILGRIKDTMIASNGENVYPDEIESYFQKIDGIINLASFMVNNKIIMVLNASEEIKDQCLEINKNLPIHKQVNVFAFTNNNLPLSSSHKVKRYLVKENYIKGEYQVQKNTHIDILKGYDEAKKKDVVSRLNSVFKKVLSVKEDVDPNGNWINDLHSDSMTYITLISEIEKEFKFVIPIEKYGKLTSLNEFAKELLDSNCK